MQMSGSKSDKASTVTQPTVCVCRFCSSVPLGHDLAEFLVVEPAVAVEVGLLHEGAQLLVRQRLAQVRRHQDDLAGLDESRSVLVEDPERLAQGLRRGYNKRAENEVTKSRNKNPQ